MGTARINSAERVLEEGVEVDSQQDHQRILIVLGKELIYIEIYIIIIIRINNFDY